MKTYTSYQSDIPRIINNSLADNITWGMEVVMDSIRYLVTKYYFNERTYTTVTASGTQFYNLPPQVKRIINVYVTVGSVRWQPKECPSRQLWDALNVITFNQDYPSYFYIYNGQFGLYPTPSSDGNVITVNYKTRIPDLSMSDATAGTVTVTSASATVTGTTTAFTSWMAQGGWLRPSHSSTTGTNGDNQWYEISSVTGANTLILKNPYASTTASGVTYTIGEVPILPEDYQDLPLYRLGMIYYTTRFPDPIRAQQYTELWNTGEQKLNDEFGSKSTSPVLTDTDIQIINPNLFQRNVT